MKGRIASRPSSEACCCSGASLAPALLGQAGQIAYEAFTLPNGLRVIYSEDHSTPIVTVDVWYNDGSRERAGGPLRLRAPVFEST